MATITDPQTLGVWYHGMSSNDLGLRLLSPLTVGLPDRNLIQVQLPYSNTMIELTSYYGKSIFNERTISISFNYDFRGSLQGGQDMYTRIQRWLYSPQGKSPLVLGHDRNYYYMAEVVSSSSRDDVRSSGTFNAVFTCYPFKISINYSNDDNWNKFMFDTDHVQLLAYKFQAPKSVRAYNDSVNEVVPIVVASDNIVIHDDLGNSYPFSQGISDQKNSLFPFKLHTGENDITFASKSYNVCEAAILLQNEVI